MRQARKPTNSNLLFIHSFTVVIIGNSQSYNRNGKFINPRGYYREELNEGKNLGQSIMIKSFQTISKELHNPDIPLWKLWPMLHVIHTTADFDMENLLWMDDEATIAQLYFMKLNQEFIFYAQLIVRLVRRFRRKNFMI